VTLERRAQSRALLYIINHKIPMQVTNSFPIDDNGHIIETGNSTWDSNEISIRNRYPTRNGGFSPRSSSEIPIRDLRFLIRVAADQDLLSPIEIAAMMASLSASLSRRLET